MIVQNIIGGLGNQMFQYACGRSLAHTRGSELRLFLGDFEGYGLHNGYELQRVFGISPALASAGDLASLVGWRAGRHARRLLRLPRLAGARGRKFVVEPSFNYWSGIDAVPASAFLVGYWQSERYFETTASLVRKDFRFQGRLNGENARLAERIRQGCSVSVHVRRGDYVANLDSQAKHGSCGMRYYEQAANLLLATLPSPQFFVFSDDPDWAEANLRGLFPGMVAVRGNLASNSYFDMWLMSLCKHHVIANSTFSWWSSWLCANENKIVVAPRQWFASGISTPDVIPDRWTRL